MIESALLEQVLRLDVESRRELVRVVEGSIRRDEVPAEVRSEVERRLAEMGPEPSTDSVTLEQFKRDRARRTG